MQGLQLDQLPDLSGLTQLEILDLTGTRILRGALPEALASLSLRVFSITGSGNESITGSIPPAIWTNWIQLEELRLDDTGLKGAVPDLRNFTNLRVVSLRMSSGINASSPFSIIDPSSPSANPGLRELNLGKGSTLHEHQVGTDMHVRLQEVVPTHRCPGGSGIPLPSWEKFIMWLSAHDYHTGLEVLRMGNSGFKGPIGPLRHHLPALRIVDLSSNAFVSCLKASQH
jgi:hypothetical protein